MAFNKIAKGNLTRPNIGAKYWENYRDRAKGRVRIASKNGNLIHQASEIVGKSFDPKDYLLSHVTIVCSVDVQEVGKSKTGKLNFEGQTINRKWADYRVSAETDKYINNNFDCWSRDVLAKSAHTFVGGQNYVEHIQIEALSKGRLIDAAIRDIGPSLYVDLLVATERKHAELIAAIELGEMSTLSMGCQVTECICTKCGNVAKDDTDLCSHIRYQKGSQFFDELGQPHRVAELCGHTSIDPTGGVNFIEASWVGTPAFTGAVRRNTIELSSLSQETAEKVDHILSTVPEQWSDAGNLKAASSAELPSYRQAFGEFEEDEEVAESTGEEVPQDALEQAKDELYQNVVDDVQKSVERAIRKDDQEDELYPENTSNNDTVQLQANVESLVDYSAAIRALKKISNSDQEFINNLALYNTRVGFLLPIDLYRTSAKVGSIGKFASQTDYFQACSQTLGVKSLSTEQREHLLRLGELLKSRSQT